MWRIVQNLARANDNKYKTRGRCPSSGSGSFDSITVYNNREGNQPPHIDRSRDTERRKNFLRRRQRPGETPGMDTERRKRQVPNGDNGRRAKARGDEVAKAASEEDVDVEEFFAILRRMHAVARYLGDRKGGNGRELTDGGRRWRPVFELEDFEGGGNGVKSRGEEKGKSEAAAAAAEEEGEKKEREDEKRATREWDLNAEPEPENAAAHSSW